MRDDKVVAKGKGELTTYWLDVKSDSSGGKSSRHSETGSERACPNIDFDLIDKDKTAAVLLTEKKNRLIDWNVDVLCRLLQQIIASHSGTLLQSKRNATEAFELSCTNPFDEVKEIIPLAQVRKTKHLNDESGVKIASEVLDQLRKYVSYIASMYNDNEFHNFEHVRTFQFCSSFNHTFPFTDS